jgi:hypothetical protein
MNIVGIETCFNPMCKFFLPKKRSMMFSILRKNHLQRSEAGHHEPGRLYFSQGKALYDYFRHHYEHFFPEMGQVYRTAQPVEA